MQAVVVLVVLACGIMCARDVTAMKERHTYMGNLYLSRRAGSSLETDVDDPTDLITHVKPKMKHIKKPEKTNEQTPEAKAEIPGQKVKGDAMKKTDEKQGQKAEKSYNKIKERGKKKPYEIPDEKTEEKDKNKTREKVQNKTEEAVGEKTNEKTEKKPSGSVANGAKETPGKNVEVAAKKKIPQKSLITTKKRKVNQRVVRDNADSVDTDNDLEEEFRDFLERNG